MTSMHITALKRISSRIRNVVKNVSVMLMTVAILLFVVSISQTTTAPKPPVNPHLAVYQESDSLRLTWSTVTRNVLNETMTVNRYKIYRLLVNRQDPNPYCLSGWSYIGATSTASFFLPDILSNTGQQYFYRIKATTDPVAGTARSFPLGDSGLSIDMRWIPAGTFLMGSSETDLTPIRNEMPKHPVIVEHGFWIGAYEITQQQWAAIIGTHPSHVGYDSSGIGDNCPVNNITWNEIQSFEGNVNNQFRLPTEAEWEYACRAGTTTRFFWGNDTNYIHMDGYCWNGEMCLADVHPVGSLRPNPWGLYDMLGNVEEYCEDAFHLYTTDQTDTSPYLDATNYCVYRGGNWGTIRDGCRSPKRSYTFKNVPATELGFRLVRDASDSD